MLVQDTLAEVQAIESSIAGTSDSELKVRLALRGCLHELRLLVADRTAIQSHEVIFSHRDACKPKLDVIFGGLS